MAQPRTVQQLLEEAKRLPLAERRLLVDAIEQDLREPGGETAEARRDALDRWIARAGTGHSDFTDVSADKYAHLAEAYADEHE